ncbi:carboxymethylenebutenolidase [Pseudovirgaria hyperparasitica]|uniref:Carboxymethylenebutenolidase n=1 Tax=Pseudovirgaria hyperparasitica TaxID=470096 RepID=A0A6A6WB13_9PEZI|nr:carboxymethylenebutenolidase [Pseudovirgaria hyperparasitica]KAF2760038.1 carboxymethylenebutenolidase [Pseudovirgaria hyperparasitica]
MPPRLHIAGDDPEFDPETIQHWKEEGYHVSYHFCDRNDPKPFQRLLKSLSDDLELGEAYALVTYGHAASQALAVHIKPQPRLCALIAYYPDTVVHANAKYPSQLQVLCHLAGTQQFSPSFKSYRYPQTQEGFAESDLEEYDKVAAGLSWSRSLAAVRRGFKRENSDLEAVWEDHVALTFTHREAAGTVRTMRPKATLHCVPTMTGGIGQKELLKFYRDFFIPSTPQSLSIRLISRTIGEDQVVDEMFVALRHTQEIDWLLPGVPPTNKQIEIMIVSVVGVRGGRLVHERLYWDQASVLVQIGLLDPKLVPKSMQDKGMERLPVAGKEAARKVLDIEEIPGNTLIPDWNDGEPSNGARGS